MSDVQAHRGPDGEGLWIAPEGNIGFAHRRLSIVDLSDLASQPMLDSDAIVCVTFNGEIYNHRELRAELQLAGRLFRTDHSDTEVLVQGYLEWGMDGLLNKLNGIFAFALHDRRTGDTHLARDQIGVKPLYFRWLASGFSFASEIKAFLGEEFPRADVSSTAAFHYLTFMAAPAPLTMFEGIYKLPAGWAMRVDASGDVKAHRYFAPWPSNSLDVLDANERIRRVRDTLRGAVERQLIADVPVGLFLSGGVDSTALLALSKQVNGVAPRTFSVGFDHPSVLDETAYAAEIAARFGAQHTEVRIGAGDVEASIDQLIREQDEPLADWVCLPLRAVAGAANSAGLKTVLCGEGADELFCGYSHYLRYLKLADGPHRWLSALHALGLGNSIAKLASGIAGRDLRKAFHADFLRRPALGQEAFWGGALVFSDGMKPTIWNGDAPAARRDERLAKAGFDDLASLRYSGEIVSHLLAALDSRGNFEQLQRMIWLELAQRLPELLLMRVDKMCMAASLEARVPFLDLEMVQLSSQFGTRSKIPDGEPKQLLKQALLGIVPEDVLNRPKKGFGAPMSDWLRGPLGLSLREQLAESAIYERLPFDRNRILRLVDLHRAGERDYAVYIWTVFNLAAWYDRRVGKVGAR